AQEKLDCVRYVVRVSEAAKSATPHNLLAVLVVEPLGHLRVDKTGCDRIHVHAHPAHLTGQRSSEAKQRSFGCCVNRKTTVAGGTDNGGDVHDSPAALRNHGTHDILGQNDGRQGVNSHQPLDLRIGRQRKNAFGTHAGIVHQAVDRTKVLLQLLDEFRNVFDFGQIERDEVDGAGTFAACKLDCLPELA